MGAAIRDSGASERLLESSEALPGMVFGCIFWRNAPEVKSGEVGGFGIKNCGRKEGNSGSELAVSRAGSGLHIIASASVIEEEGSGDDLAGIMDEIESGEGLSELGL